MLKSVEKIMNEYEKLYRVYESYVWKDESNRKIVVIIENNEITFYLKEKDKKNHNFTVTFDGSETKAYYAVALRILAMLFGNVPVSNDDTLYYSKGYKKYIQIFVRDEKVNQMFKELVSNQDKEYISKDNVFIANAVKKAKFVKFIRTLINTMDERIEDIKKKLKV